MAHELQKVLPQAVTGEKDAEKIVDYIDIEIGRGIAKNRILMLDILANFDWKRPIYFTGGAFADEEYIWLKDYLQLDGMAYKLVPIKTSMNVINPDGTVTKKSPFDMGRIDPEKMYANIQKLDWRNINDGKIYLDEQTKRSSISMRNNLMRLSDAFATQGDTVKALEILDLSIEKMPIKDFSHFSLSVGYPEMYYLLGEPEKARSAAEALIKIFKEQLIWLAEFPKEDSDQIFEEIDNNLLMYRNIIATQIDRFDIDEEYKTDKQNEFIETVKLFNHLMPEEE